MPDITFAARNEPNSCVMPADTVSVLNWPEWPVAGLVLERFLLMLKSERGLESSATATRQVGTWQRAPHLVTPWLAYCVKELPCVRQMARGSSGIVQPAWRWSVQSLTRAWKLDGLAPSRRAARCEHCAIAGAGVGGHVGCGDRGSCRRW